MRQPVDGKTTKISIEQFQMVQNPASAILRKRDIVPHDDLPILLRALRHIVKIGAFFLVVHWPILSPLMLNIVGRRNKGFMRARNTARPKIWRY